MSTENQSFSHVFRFDFEIMPVDERARLFPNLSRREGAFAWSDGAMNCASAVSCECVPEVSLAARSLSRSASPGPCLSSVRVRALIGLRCGAEEPRTLCPQPFHVSAALRRDAPELSGGRVHLSVTLRKVVYTRQLSW